MAFVDIQKRYKAAREVRRYYERNWQLNIAFFMNEQWTTVDQTGRLRQVLPANNKKPRLSSNLIRPRVRLEYAAVASQPVKYRVVVRPPAPDAATKSKVAYSYLTYLWQTYDYGEMFLDALLWALICGTSFVKWYFDPHAGPLYDMGSVVEPAGDPLIDVVAPFELCIDPHARRLDEASWVVHERLRSREYVREKYGKEVSGGTGQHNSFIQALSLLKLHQVHHRVPSVLVCEYWEKPTARVPGGYYCVFAGNTVLYEGDNPYEETPIPFAAMRHTPTPGTVWGDSHVTDLRQINVVYNRLRCDILENSVKLSNPPLVAPHGSLWQEPEWTPGEVVYYNPLVAQGGKIDQVRIEPFPSQLVNMLLRLEQEADEHAGVTLLMRGMAPRGVRSAEQLSLLQQADETRRSIVRNEYLGMVEVALNGVLALARQFCVLPRLVEVTGDERGAMLFKGSDMPRSARVQVYVEGKPSTQELERQAGFLAQLFDRGIIQDPRLILRSHSQATLEDAAMDVELDTSHAQRENDKLVKGERVVVEDWHNHTIHLLEHNRYRKTAEYETLPARVKKLFAEHAAAHMQFLQQQTATAPKGAVS